MECNRLALRLNCYLDINLEEDRTVREVVWTLENKVCRQAYNKGQWQAQLKKNGEVSFFTFPRFQEIDFIRHGFSTREGGVSQGELSTMNLSYSRGDIPERVDENYKRICTALGMDTRNLVLSDQVHDTIVYQASKKDCQGQRLQEKKLEGIDGLITDEKEVVLCTSYADCVPLFFVDERHKAIGSSHSGWRGTAGKIGAKTVKAMQQAYGTMPEEVKVVIGPSICQSCYEVSEDVYQEMREFVSPKEIAKLQQMPIELVESMVDSVFLSKPQNKYQLDLWMANKLILMEAGVLEKNISVSCVCTCCNSKLLFSHRATGGKRGNLNGFLEIKK